VFKNIIFNVTLTRPGENGALFGYIQNKLVFWFKIALDII